MEGGTEITITGLSLHALTHCRFTNIETGSRFISVIINGSITHNVPGAVSCITPDVGAVGVHQLDFTTEHGSRITDTRFFAFFPLPLVYASASETADGRVRVFGEGFPLQYRTYCKLRFSSGIVLTVDALVKDTFLIYCEAAPYRVRARSYVTESWIITKWTD